MVLGAFDGAVARAGSYYIFPPSGLQCLAQAIGHRSEEVRILDLNHRILRAANEDPGFSVDAWPRFLEAELDAFEPDLVGVSCLFDFAIGPLIQVLEMLRARGNCIVVAGGATATFEAKRLLNDGLCHFVVDGEGENKLNLLLDHLGNEDRGTTPVPGIHFKDDATLHETEGVADVVDLAGDLVSTYDLVAVEGYYRYGSLNPYSRMAGEERQPFAAIQFSRGCRAACTFCSVRDFMGKGVRHRPVGSVLAEMEFLIREKGVRHFEWLDDDLLFHRAAIRELLGAIIAKGWDIRWSANNGLIASSLDPEMVELLRDSGCIGFKIGVETGNPDMLRKVKKPGNHDKFRAVAHALEDAPEIFVGANFILGLPDERFHQMVDSFKFALETGLDWAAMTVCQVIRGASAFADAGEYFESQMAGNGKVANFIPSRLSAAGEVSGGEDGLRTGPGVFDLDPALVPDGPQVKEIWFTFNTLANYVFNRNLMAGGRPEKFIAWVESVIQAYPANAIMNLFLSLAHVIAGNMDKAGRYRGAALKHINEDYWHRRFVEFGLNHLLAADPQTPGQAHAALEAARQAVRPVFQAWLETPYGETPQAGDTA